MRSTGGATRASGCASVRRADKRARPGVDDELAQASVASQIRHDFKASLMAKPTRPVASTPAAQKAMNQTRRRASPTPARGEEANGRIWVRHEDRWI